MASVKKVRNDSLVPVNSSEISVRFDNTEVNEQISSALEVQKEQIIVQQAREMNVVLLSKDLEIIKSNVGSEFESLASLRVVAAREIAKYQAFVNAAVRNEVNKQIAKIEKLQNESSQRQFAEMKELEKFVHKHTEDWQQIVVDTKRIFDTSKFDVNFGEEE